MIGSQVASLWAKLGADTSDLERGLVRSEQAMKKTAGQASLAGAAIATAFTAAAAAVVTGLGAAVSKAMDFERQMSAVKAIGGLTRAEIDQLGASALSLGPKWATSATKVGAGMEELVKAGISTKDIMEGAAEGTLTLAKAGGVELAQAAEVAATAIQVFNLRGTDMGHVADYMAGAANATIADINDLRLSMSMASAVSAQMGQTFEGTTTVISLMAQAGMKGSDAGTSLKTMMLSLVPTSKEAAAAMKEVGIITAEGANRFFDANNNAKSYREIAQVLQETLSGLSDKQRIATMQTIFGTDAVRAATVMVKAGAEGYDQMVASIEKVKAADVARERLDNLAGSVDKAKAAAETAAIAIGRELAPGLKTAADNAALLIAQLTPGLLDALRSVAKIWTIGLNLDIKMPSGFSGRTGLGNFFDFIGNLGRVPGELQRDIDTAIGISRKAENEAQFGPLPATLGPSLASINRDTGPVITPAQAAWARLVGQQQRAGEREGLPLPSTTALRDNLFEMEKFGRMQAAAETAADNFAQAEKDKEKAIREAASAAKSAASAAQSDAESLANTIERKTVDAGQLIRDMGVVAEESGERLADIGRKFEAAFTEAEANVRRSIDATRTAAEDALQAIDDQERINADAASRRATLDVTLSAKERSVRERQRDEEFHFRENREQAHLLQREMAELAKARTEEEKRDIRQRYQEERDALRERHIEFDQDTRFRIAQEDEFARLRAGWDKERADLAAQLHKEDLDRRRLAITDERDRKIRAIEEEWRVKAAQMEAEKRQAIADEEEKAKKKLATMKQNFWDQVPAAAAPGLAGVAGLIEAAFNAAVSSVAANAAAQLNAIAAAAAGLRLGGGGDGGDDGGNPNPFNVDPRAGAGDPGRSGIGGMGPGGLGPLGPGQQYDFDPDSGSWSIVSMDTAGAVPGPWGRPRLVMARGGEEFGGFPPSRTRGGQAITITVTGNTILGDEQRVARELARMLKPELDRITGASW